MNHHIFEIFRPFLAGHFVDSVPPVDEEYFEWVDLLLAIWQAGQRGKEFVMAEVGAGQGRWGIRAAQAAFFAGLNSHVVFVEAEPEHCKWLRDAVAREFIGQHKEARIHECAIDYDHDTVPFLIRRGTNDATNWFGQHRCSATGQPTNRIYHGHQVFSIGEDEWVEVPATTIEKVLEAFPVVDLLDMDIQGAELDVVTREIDVLNAKVRRVHIGTHSRTIEQAILEKFEAYGWLNIWDFEGEGTRGTPFGRAYFQDGVQSWRNPKL